MYTHSRLRRAGVPDRDRHLPARTVAVPSPFREVLAMPGRPIDPAVRSEAERHLGRDFSHVRVHTDAAAAASAEEINATAYTAGRDIVFGSGHYQPSTSAGRQLLAHELTHVLQQSSGMSGPG